MILEFNFTARLQTFGFKLHHWQSDFKYYKKRKCKLYETALIQFDKS